MVLVWGINMAKWDETVSMLNRMWPDCHRVAILVIAGPTYAVSIPEKLVCTPFSAVLSGWVPNIMNLARA